ncbi:MAG: hypothetical protein AB7T49_11710 [Oligoflexales bacterium]
MNPSYSLRAFAKFLGMQPSKVSEVLSNKKGVSLVKARELCKKLRLSHEMQRIFELSVIEQHARTAKERLNAGKQLKSLLAAEKKKPSSQLNGWYFGAIQKLLEFGITEDGKIGDLLGLTDLQVENAKRFIQRIRKLHPDVTEISLEPASVIKKITEAFVGDQAQIQLQTNFFFLSSDGVADLMKLMAREAKARESTVNDSDFYMFNMAAIKLINGDKLC